MTKLKGAPHRYCVKLMRPVFQVTVVEVEAATEDEAVGAAKFKASLLDDLHWQGQYDPDQYTYDVQEVLDYDDMIEDHPEFQGMDEGPDDDIKYVLLRADTYSGEGATPFQPWLEQEGPLMISDLTGDWIAQLQHLNESSTGAWREELEAIRPEGDDPDGSDEPGLPPAA